MWLKRLYFKTVREGKACKNRHVPILLRPYFTLFYSNQIPQAYYHIRLANNQSAFKSWRKKRRSAQGRVMYTKTGVNVLGNPYIVNGTTISGRKIYIGPR